VTTARNLAFARMGMLAPLLLSARSSGEPEERVDPLATDKYTPRPPAPSAPPPPPPRPLTEAEVASQKKRARRAARLRREAGFQPAPITTRRLPIPPPGAFCDHSAMAECHPPADGRPGCRHFACPCGIAWDEGVQL